jgi:hypothetical protein
MAGRNRYTKEVQLVVVKKTSRTAKSPVPSAETSADSPARIGRARRPAARPAATSAAGGAAKPKARAKRTAAAAAVEVEANGIPLVVTDEDIRVRAYFLSIEHRGQGSPEYFWQLAERELRQRGNSR